jgi:hypothetical protein
MTMQFTGHSRVLVLSRERFTRHLCCASNLEVAPSFLEKLCAPDYLLLTGHHMYRNLHKSMFLQI